MVVKFKFNVVLFGAVSLLALQASSVFAEPKVEEGLGRDVPQSIGAKLYAYGAKAGFPGVNACVETAKSNVRSAVKARGEEILDAKAAQVGKLAQNKFRELLLKDSSVRIVNGNGEEVGLHIEKANSEVVRSLVRKLSGLDLDQSIPGVPTPIAKFVLNKVENYLLAYASEYFGDAVQKLTYNLAVQALGQAWNVGSDKLQKHLQAAPESVMSTPIKVDANGLEEHQVTALQGLVDHYRSKLKLTVSGMVEEAARAAVASIAAEAYNTVEEKAEVAVRAAAFSPIVYKVPVLAPVAWLFDAFTAQKGSKVNQLVRWALGAERTEAKLVAVATANVGGLLKTIAPSWLVVKGRDLQNVFGKFGSRSTDEGFTEIYQTEAPKSVSQLLFAFATKTKETVKNVAQAASDFTDLMGPEGISQEEFAEKYGNEDPTNPLPAIVNAGKSVFSKAKSFFGW